MSQLCIIGGETPRTPQIDAQEQKMGILLSPDKIFSGDQLLEFQKPENWSKYGEIHDVILILRQYVSGSCSSTYPQLKEQIAAWNHSDRKNDPLNVAAKESLIRILGSIEDPALKEKAILAAVALRQNTSNIVPAKPAEPEKPVMLPDAASREALPAIARPDPNATPAKEWMSDQAIFSKHIEKWTSEAKLGRFYTLHKMIETLRSYLDGKASETELQARIKAWAKHECFQDSLSKVVLITLGFQLGVSKPKKLDANVSKRVDRALDLLPKIKSDKPDEVAKPAADVKAAEAKGDAGKVLEALSDSAILGDKISAYSEAGAKYGKYYPLYKMLENVRSYVRGDKDASYTTLKQKIEAWTKSETYKEEVSQRVRAQLISILTAQKAAVSDKALISKIDTLLLLIQKTPAVETATAVVEAPTPPASVDKAPATPVATSYAFNLAKMDVPAGEPLDAQAFVKSLQDLAERATANYGKKSGAFAIKALPTLHFDEKGYLNQVSFAQVSAESGITNGEQMSELLSEIASHWRNIRFQPNAIVPIGKKASPFGSH